MATHDYVIANASGAAVRADLNNALAAIVSNNSGSSEPGTTYAFQWWADTNASQLKLRNAANDDWVVIQELDGTMLMENGTVGSPGLAFASDLDTGFFRPAANQLAVATNGVERLEIGTTEVVFNDGGNDINFRVEGDANANMLFVDAGNDRVGVGTSSPNESLEVAGNGLKISGQTSGVTDEGITFDWDSGSNNGRIFSESAGSSNLLFFTTNSGTRSERMRLDSSGRLGIGTTATQQKLTIDVDSSGTSQGTFDGINICNTNTTANNGSAITFGQLAEGNANARIGVIQTARGPSESQEMFFGLLGSGSYSERMRIDSSGRLLVGTSSNFVRGEIQAISAGGGEITIGRTDTSVASGNDLGHLFFASNDSGTGVAAGNISCFAEGDHTSSSAPVNLRFNVCASGSTSPTERMRIDSNGEVIIGATTYNADNNGIGLGSGGLFYATRAGGACAIFNRNTDDGQIILFRQASADEGSITVSGSTVSYNGAHLARWSQLPSGAERTEILRGSVLSNLDEMCEWAYDAQDAVLYTENDELPEGVNVGDVKVPARDAGTEDNEQLNRMKVSDVEGDKNVSGVFQAWDDDDDTYTNDFYCAMTGDFVIRIAKGTTVERGDLLMSAGDGTAKPQDDDIVRSKTIAKVTSTTVSTTYSDGSFCVPCVLMAC